MTFLQLVLLSIIMVGQTVQSAASDARAAKEFNDTETILDRLDTNTAGGIKAGARCDPCDRQPGRRVGNGPELAKTIELTGTCGLPRAHAFLRAAVTWALFAAPEGRWSAETVSVRATGLLRSPSSHSFMT